ncbi:MAG: DUF1338 family protein [Alphaproteobacteria bacterium]|nr:DUF1338 family protein [Alphaproteobacteria bacterium]MBU1515204.1 DUF1338 family protein [Alphaproteobacteria bacterium]MBU2092334.1 DUF1338 family protein [Alphaproteobacteria bacterium]MBU2152928.1 DUF1338 family protein [Alphaproteobacteria bacterium]MBU2305759.1 DUF1338 family protein [Alphaproteobacteria bacterium]
MPVSTLAVLLDGLPGRPNALLANLDLHPDLTQETGRVVSQSLMAQALNIALLAALLERAPTAAAYMQDLRLAGGRLTFDHGAMRTVDLGRMGDLPRGETAFTRILRPLGYVLAAEYPLTALRMTGRAYAHAERPEHIPQFFVSELHVDRFSETFQDAAVRITGASRDPLVSADLRRLDRMAEERRLSLDDASALLPRLAACFGRNHPTPRLSDYETVRGESAEMAWIATEGNAFNHATDRVASLAEVTQLQRAKDRPLKAKVEVSKSGRVRQTAFLADQVRREFHDEHGVVIERVVPGSFFEFIERDRLPDGQALDLSFDSGNAQGIFKMTEAAA